MGRWGRCDYKELEKLNQRLEQLSSVDFDAFCRDAAKDLAARLLAKVKKRTPVGVPPTWIEGEKALKYWSGYKGGSLRKNWTIILPIEKHGDIYQITVANNLEYASYVEYGHRQTPGRKVGVIERHLTANWVPGKKMMTISAQELEVQAPPILEARLYKFLKDVF